MDRQKFEQSCAIKFCVKLGESATVTYEKYEQKMDLFYSNNVARISAPSRETTQIETRHIFVKVYEPTLGLYLVYIVTKL
jgi:hypothetical protein